MAPPTFVMSYLSSMPTHSENLTYLASTIQKFKLFELPFEGHFPNVEPPISGGQQYFWMSIIVRSMVHLRFEV